jgi:hypothetical protein
MEKFMANLNMSASPPHERLVDHHVQPAVARWVAHSGDYAKINVDAAVSLTGQHGDVTAIGDKMKLIWDHLP